MKVAVAADNNVVAGHFGHCQGFILAEVTDGRVTSRETIRPPGTEHCAVPRFLVEKGVQAIICGSMGPHAQELFAAQHIETWLGAIGPVDAILKAFAEGRLSRGDSTCDHGAGGNGHQCRHGHRAGQSGTSPTTGVE